ncbi:hypothetical protein FHW58_000486 [Duganella sp. 1224]|uniref:DUF3024 domain-containing protein n=1 Tax=Duganella sp. 1224 TaxID=2587052 RepID=UPI0015CB9B5A|nr:hypothetical protein [Duganella sp. 1224]NYE59334.1 hypothetical protein [Duganella sp. 1224]
MLNDLEKKKIENAVGSFVARRRPPVHVRQDVDLDFRITGHSVEIFGKETGKRMKLLLRKRHLLERVAFGDCIGSAAT